MKSTIRGTREVEEHVFTTKPYKDFVIEANYLVNTEESKGDSLVEVFYKKELVREFLFPSYKIFNIAAHHKDIIESEINNDNRGYLIAGSTGLGGNVFTKSN